jgi:ArsR family transcriptional regulator
MTKAQRLSRFYQALSDETRLRLVALLVQQERGSALCVTRLADELGTTVPNLSQHLRVLKDLGLVRGERRGLRIHYFLVPERLAQYQRLARELLGNAFSAGIGAMSPHGQEPPAHEPADPSSTIA